ncbi:Integrin alpha N-terminal domain-containing protein [Balamuthia mandrillaris]
MKVHKGGLKSGCLLFLAMSAVMVAVEGNSFFRFFDEVGANHNGPSFSESRLYSLEAGLKEVEGHVACFGDMDSDKYNDLFIVSGEDQTRIDVYVWNHDKFRFVKKPEATIQESMPITNVVGADFNYDGKLDLLVSGPSVNKDRNIDPAKRGDTGSYYLHIYLGNYRSFDTQPPLVLEESLDQVLVLDSNGDLLPDLFGTSAVTGKRSYWINTSKARSLSIQVTEQSTEESKLQPLAAPRFNAFVDLDGDCASDLYVTATGETSNEEEQAQSGNSLIEIWENKKGSFVRRQGKGFELPDGAGQPLFADMNGDGTIDIVYPICIPTNTCTTENSLIIVYNEQKPVCRGWWDSDCRPSTELCSADSNYLKDTKLLAPHFSENVVHVPQAAFKGARFYKHPHLEMPITLRAGDYNLDGYTDLLIPVIDPHGRVFVQLWKNKACEDAKYGCKREGSHVGSVADRTLVPIDDDDEIKALTSIDNAYAAAFFDLNEDGSPDILVMVDDSISGGNGRRVEAIFNNFQNDVFFLKTLGLNGVCTEWCNSGPKFPDPKPYGVNYAGGVFKFTVTDLSGKKRMRQGGQLYQSSYLPLQTPYNVFGLGRTSNYIEDFAYGISSNHDPNWNSWICIIPNSQLVAIPYKPDDPQSWKLELYIKPSGLALWVALAILSALFALAVIIFLFHWREKRQDEKEKQENAHLFSFSAL